MGLATAPVAHHPGAGRTPDGHRLAGVGFTLVLHLLLLLWLLRVPPPSASEPAALPPVQVSLIGASGQPPPPPPVRFDPALPPPDLPLPALNIASPDPPAPSAAMPGATDALAALRRAGAADAACLPRAWLEQMSRAVSMNLQFPVASRHWGEQGTAYVRVSVRRDGAVLSAPILRSSGSRNLDVEASAVFRRIAHFNPLPPDQCAGYDVIVIDQPVRFARRG